MKSIFYSLSVFTLLFSCNKKTPTPSLEQPTKRTEISVPKEVKFADLKQKMGVQNNDTTYVYNFFATWCGPCMKEIPHFKEKMEETKNQPIKFVFISIDEKTNWATDLQDFANEQQLGKSLLKYNVMENPADFAKQLSKTWDGSSIPFTYIRKGEKTTEVIGGINIGELTAKIKEVQ